MSAAIVGNASLTHFDALVIGSGAGGSSVAAVLASNGNDVLVLEAGPNFYEGLDDPDPKRVVTRFSNDELKLTRRSLIMPDPLVEPRTYRSSEADGDRTFTGAVNSLPKTVGGAAVHADVKTPRFQPMDFQLGTLLGSVPGAAFADWPVDYAALEPFYAYAEGALGVQGKAGADPFEGPRSGEYPMPPGVPMYIAAKLAKAAESLGYHPFPYPTAVNSRPYDGRPACVDCGFCGEYGCPSHAKGGPAVTLLRKALLSGHCQLRPETRAVKLLVSPTKKDITGVEVIRPDGSRETLTADRYLLAASPIEDARLLLLSDPGGPGVGNSSGLVGRHLMFHYQTYGIGVFDERFHTYRGRTVTHGMSDFRGVPGDATKLLGGILEFGGGSGPIAEAINYAQNALIFGTSDGARLKALMRQSPLRDRLATLTLQAEDAPQANNRVDLDPAVRDLDGLPAPRVTYTNHAFETAARALYAPKLLDILMAAGARYAFNPPADAISSSRHVMGTLRFGTDPAASVCDATGRFHDVGNLYAADGSLFPTSSGYNPILTIVALASWVGGSIVSPGSPEKAIA